MQAKLKEKKKTGRGKTALIIIAAIICALIIGEAVSCSWKSNPENIIQYETDNPYITSGAPMISGHRSGGGITPEESMMAFKNCAENPNFSIDIFEFDLHITKDDVLILLHDDTLDRTSDCVDVFGKEEIRPEDYTYEELRSLNIGAKFVDPEGNMPYADLHGDDVPDDLKIVRLEDVLDYLINIGGGKYDYIIEIKNGGELGMKGLDILYKALVERELLDDVVFGTFHGEISDYADNNYPDLSRSATIKEVLSFYGAALVNKKDFTANYTALQIPYNMPYRLIGNLATARMVNYAHKNNLALQYWTINKRGEMEYLTSVGADCIMSDYPDITYDVVCGDISDGGEVN